MISETNNFICPTDEIAAYIDGELSSARELELDAHFVACCDCTAELNEQKQFLHALDASLGAPGEIDLPTDFAKRVVVNAESTVSGLRRPRERFNALFICAGLFLFVLFALGTDTGSLLSSAANFFEQVSAIGGFFAHLVYSVFLGLAIIVRTLAAQFPVQEAFAVVLAGSAFIFFLLLISRRVLRVRSA
jgi:anti-sigma factor RsiW